MNPHDTLGNALDTLAAGLGAQHGVAPEVDTLWRDGSRRRFRVRALVGGAALAALALLVATLTLPGARPESLPATSPGERPTSYPARVAMPWSITETSRPGASALAVVTRESGSLRVRTVGPTGTVSTLRTAAPVADGELDLSPDGQVLALGPVLHDLVTGTETEVPVDRAYLPTRAATWWSPDSLHTYVAGRGGSGVVVDRAGRSIPVPPSGGGDGVKVAGWSDDSTLLAVWQSAPDRFTLATWTLGAGDWSLGATIEWPAWPDHHSLRASVSPGGTRILLYGGWDVPAPNGVPTVVGQVFDVASGAVVGVPVGDTPAAEVGWDEESYVDWQGTGCRPAWQDGVPVTTDGVARSLDPARHDDVVALSSGFGSPCLALAGGVLPGQPVPNTVAVWSERARTAGPWLLVVVAGGLLLWRFSRGRPWAAGHEQLPPMPPPYGR